MASPLNKGQLVDLQALAQELYANDPGARDEAIAALVKLGESQNPDTDFYQSPASLQKVYQTWAARVGRTLPPQPTQPVTPPTTTPGGTPEIDQKSLDYLRQSGLSEDQIASFLAGRGKKPPATVSTLQDEQGLLRSALDRIGVRVSPKDFAAIYTQVHDNYVDVYNAGLYKGDLNGYRQYLEDQTNTTPPGNPLESFGQPWYPPAPARAPLMDTIDKLSQQRDEAAQAKTAGIVGDTAAHQAWGADYRTAFGKARLEDLRGALKELGARYPAAKSFLNQLTPVFEGQYNDFISRQRGQTGDAATETNGLGGVDVSPASWVRGYLEPNLNQIMSDNGVGPQWQQLMFSDAFNRVVAAPIRAAATTPAAQQQAEAHIAALEKSALPVMQQQFALAARSDPTLTATNYLASPSAQGLLSNAGATFAQGQARAQAATQQQAQDMAFKGYDTQTIATQLGITPEQAATYASSGANLRLYETNLAAQALPGGGTLKPSDVAATVGYINANIGARNSALDLLTGGRFRATQRAADIAQSDYYNRLASAQARDAAHGELVVQAINLGAKVGLYGGGRDFSTGGAFQSASSDELRNWIAQVNAIYANDPYHFSGPPKAVTDIQYTPEFRTYASDTYKNYLLSTAGVKTPSTLDTFISQNLGKLGMAFLNQRQADLISSQDLLKRSTQLLQQAQTPAQLNSAREQVAAAQTMASKASSTLVPDTKLQEAASEPQFNIPDIPSGGWASV